MFRENPLLFQFTPHDKESVFYLLDFWLAGIRDTICSFVALCVGNRWHLILLFRLWGESKGLQKVSNEFQSRFVVFVERIVISV